MTTTFTHVFTAATKFMKKLDDRHQKDILKRGNSNLQTKPRVLGSPSPQPRVPAPEWAVVDEPSPVVSQQQAPIGDASREVESSDQHSDSDSDFNIADLF